MLQQDVSPRQEKGLPFQIPEWLQVPGFSNNQILMFWEWEVFQSFWKMLWTWQLKLLGHNTGRRKRDEVFHWFLEVSWKNTELQKRGWDQHGSGEENSEDNSSTKEELCIWVLQNLQHQRRTTDHGLKGRHKALSTEDRFGRREKRLLLFSTSFS
jgi:hypothetical protein